MKKIFTLFAATVVGLCAYAQEPPCPSQLQFALLDASAVNKVEIELQLTNASENLNGFNMQVQKAEGSESLVFRKSGGEYFNVEGYGNVILARWETTTEEDEETGEEVTVPVTDEMRENKLPNKLDNKNSINPNGQLVIVQILSTNDCRFYPVLETPTGIGKFFLNMSNCTDGEYTLIAPDDPTHCSFSFTRGPEPLTAWTSDAPIEITLEKTGDEIKDITGISTIAVDQPVDNRIFDLQGRELQSVPEHGIYIQNGKKYVK